MKQNVEKLKDINKIAMISLFTLINIIGGQLAFLLHLPIYLDCIGSMMCAVLYGPFYAIFPPIVYGLIMQFTMDPYAVYYILVGVIVSLLTSVFIRKTVDIKITLFIYTAFISLPGTVIASFITAKIFSGVTSSGSSIFVQILNKLGISLTTSVFLTQVVTDYLDRTVSLLILIYIFKILPSSLIYNKIMFPKK